MLIQPVVPSRFQRVIAGVICLAVCGLACLRIGTASEQSTAQVHHLHNESEV